MDEYRKRHQHKDEKQGTSRRSDFDDTVIDFNIATREALWRTAQ
jgi:hypothetical protein